MKNFIFTCFIILTTVFAQAQTTKPIDGFLGIRFGSMSEQVIATLTAKGAVLDKSNSKETELTFDNVKLGNRKVKEFWVRLVNNKVYEADFYFQDDLEAKTIEYYNALVIDISGVYGTGKSIKNFKQPYQDGDGYEITAIKSGNADYKTLWIDDATKNSIMITIGADTEIALAYQDNSLVNTAIDQQKEKNKSDL